MVTETALSEGKPKKIYFSDRPLRGGEGHVAEVGREHFRLCAELHALIDAVVASIVVAGECITVLVLVIIVLVVIGAAIVAEVVGLAGLALLEDVEGVVPRRKSFCEISDVAAIMMIIFVIVVVVVVGICIHILNDLDGIQVSRIFSRTRRVSVETKRHASLGKGLHVVVYVVPILVGLVCLGAPAGPGLAIALHEVVLVFGPDADTLVLVELLHPLVVVRLLEQTEKLEVGIAEMAIILGAAAALCDAGGLVPLAGVAVEELILTDALSLVVKVDVLQRVVWREIFGKGGSIRL